MRLPAVPNHRGLAERGQQWLPSEPWPLLIVAALTNEAETGRMQTWLGDQAAKELAISGWVTAEFSAALSIKLRTGQIEAGHPPDHEPFVEPRKAKKS